ncbi:hypothetical protein FNF27_01087 [Cafeteria roenbergensis]|nr:hypothetical protein FNF31_06557 [Cafeteria roenbergensis]KAA0156771.1 hypothetical protein FNF29_00882 [Cafeteria roenbergensis]KAA0177309.1 hypothetical protein FNF27_01087 [Cafeteria roenbergensis]|eukprot:KAA0156771.1 hypothetical protein FNF29_00882 [Cafeteria roenbergensis]
MRDVLHRCIIEASGEIDGVGEISERALNSIADIVLDYLQSVGETARGVAELQCRTRVNVGDLLLGMRGNDVAPAAKPCAAAMEAIRASQAAEADLECSRIHKIDISQAVAKSSAKAEANTATNTKRISVLARRHAGASGLGMLPSWAPPLPLNRRHVARGQADDAGPTGKEAGEAAVAQREEGMSLPASLARHTANAMREEMHQNGDTSSTKRQGALPQAEGPRSSALAASMPSLPVQSVQPIIRWASMAAVGASVNPAWGPPPETDVAQHAKRARPADFGEEPSTTAVAVGGGLRRERQPTDPLSAATGTVPGVDDGSSRVASLSDGHLRIMPPNPAESGVPRSNEIRSAGFPGSGPSAPLRRIAEEASKEELLSGTFMPDPSGVAGAE